MLMANFHFCCYSYLVIEVPSEFERLPEERFSFKLCNLLTTGCAEVREWPFSVRIQDHCRVGQGKATRRNGWHGKCKCDSLQGPDSQKYILIFFLKLF